MCVRVDIACVPMLPGSVLHMTHDSPFGPTWAHIKYGVMIEKIVCQVIYLALAYPVQQSFGYYLFKIASANIEMQGAWYVCVCVKMIVLWGAYVCACVCFVDFCLLQARLPFHVACVCVCASTSQSCSRCSLRSCPSSSLTCC